jgi:hypothetical protein
MKTKTILIVLLFFLGFIPSIIEAHTPSILVNEGGWSKTISANNLVSGPGSNLIGEYESNSDLVEVNISGASGTGDNWRIDIKKTDTTWNNNLHFWAKRNNDGTGGGSISGGTSYLQITNIDQSFFSGSYNRDDIHIQYKLSGVSVSIPPKEYKITITYTVVDI